LITSTAVLGPFSPGDLVSLQFLGAWDDCSEGAVPNWEIKTVDFEPTVENREADAVATLVTIAEAAVIFTTNAPVAYQ